MGRDALDGLPRLQSDVCWLACQLLCQWLHLVPLPPLPLPRACVVACVGRRHTGRCAAVSTVCAAAAAADSTEPRAAIDLRLWLWMGCQWPPLPGANMGADLAAQPLDNSLQHNLTTPRRNTGLGGGS